MSESKDFVAAGEGASSLLGICEVRAGGTIIAIIAAVVVVVIMMAYILHPRWL